MRDQPANRPVSMADEEYLTSRFSHENIAALHRMTSGVSHVTRSTAMASGRLRQLTRRKLATNPIKHTPGNRCSVISDMRRCRNSTEASSTLFPVKHSKVCICGRCQVGLVANQAGSICCIDLRYTFGVESVYRVRFMLRTIHTRSARRHTGYDKPFHSGPFG